MLVYHALMYFEGLALLKSYTKVVSFQLLVFVFGEAEPSSIQELPGGAHRSSCVHK